MFSWNIEFLTFIWSEKNILSLKGNAVVFCFLKTFRIRSGIGSDNFNISVKSSSGNCYLIIAEIAVFRSSGHYTSKGISV